MFSNRWSRAIALFVVPVLCAACVTARLPPISDTGVGFQPLKDERKLWELGRAEEAKLRDNVELYRDPLLEEYLESVTARLNSAEMAANPEIGYRVGVIEDPTLNAFTYAHGSIYVHTGLLARMENEDQLATVLGHEMTHVENRHMVRHRRSARNKRIGFGIGAVAAAVVLAGEEGSAYKHGNYGKGARIGVLGDVLVGLGLQLAFIASVNGFGRDLEREADRGGFAKMSAAGYEIDEAPKVYEALLEDHGDAGKAGAFFFGNHPRLVSRIESAREWIAERPRDDTPRRGPSAGEFERRIRPVIRDDAKLNLESGRLKLAESQLERVKKMMPEDPETHLLIGRLELRKIEREKDPVLRVEMTENAALAFAEAIRLDPDRPGPHREVGLLAYRSGNYETACAQFREYVELDPDAEDAERIRDYVLELQRDDQCP